MARSVLTATKCKSCKAQGFAHQGTWPSTVRYVVTKPGKVPLGDRLQASGAAMSVFMSGANKGGYAMQAEANRKPDKGKLVCARCGGDRIEVHALKVKPDEAIRLLTQDD